MAKFVNLTPHTVTITGADGTVLLTVAPSGTVARCAVSTRIVDVIDGIEIRENVFGEASGVPEPQKDTYYLVSRLVATACNRSDLLVPDGAVRDEQGRIIGCTGLSR